MNNGEWLSAIPHCLNSIELSQEKFWDNLHLRYGLMPRNIIAAYDGCVEKFSVEHDLSLTRGALFWCGMMTLQRSGITLNPKPLSLVIYHTSLKFKIVQYKGKGPGLERVRKVR